MYHLYETRSRGIGWSDFSLIPQAAATDHQAGLYVPRRFASVKSPISCCNTALHSVQNSPVPVRATMEGLSTAASDLAKVSIAVQLAGSVDRLYDFQ